MNKITIEDKIIEYFDFELERKLYKSIINQFSKDDRLSAPSFNNVMHINNISKDMLKHKTLEYDPDFKEFFQKFYRELHNTETIKQYRKKNGELSEYTRFAPESIVSALFSLTPHNYYFSLRECMAIFKNQQIKNFVSENSSEDVIFIIDQAPLRKYLDDISTEKLKALLLLLDNDVQEETFPSVSLYDRLLDDTNNENAILLYDNFDNIIPCIEPLYTLMRWMQYKSDDFLTETLYRLKKIRYNKAIPIENEQIIRINYPQNISNNLNMFELRYKLLHQKLCDYDDFTTDQLAFIFLDMSELKWNIIKYVFRAYTNPICKSASKHFEINST